ncbi:hypothetical protein GGD70_007855 [Paraburkholderia fungorum]|nr:hypothetical protein [Paraburkholderia fungorum]
MFYSDYGVMVRTARIVEYSLVFFAEHFNWYANGRVVQSESYGRVVWC